MMKVSIAGIRESESDSLFALAIMRAAAPAQVANHGCECAAAVHNLVSARMPAAPISIWEIDMGNRYESPIIWEIGH